MPLYLGVVPPILTPYYRIILWVLIIEVIIVVVLGGLGIGMQWYLKKQRERSKKARTRMKQMLLLLTEKDMPFEDANWKPRSWQLGHILPVVLDIDKTIDRNTWSHSWGQRQMEIQEKYLLPMARKLTYKHRWTKKLRAVRCFALAPKKEDEKYILHLLKQKIPIIKFSAAHVAGKIATPAAFNALLEEMNVSSHYLRHPFHDAFKEGGDAAYQYLEKRLESETNPFIRVSCLEILSGKMNDHIISLLEPDLNAQHKNLKLAAIRALGHYKTERSIQLTLPHLQNPQWEVRAIAARSLGYLQAREAIPTLIRLCRDKVWWVRMNSALALKRIGPEGIASLRALKAEQDQYGHETAQYVLALEE